MDKYLVIVDFNSGIAQLGNVAIVEAESQGKAKDKFIHSSSYSDSIKHKLKTKLIKDVDGMWKYYY